MAAPDQLPKITNPLVTQEPSIHGSSPLANELSANDVLQRLPIKRQVGDDLFQPRIFICKGLQSAHLIGQ